MPAIDITGLCLPLKPQKEKVDRLQLINTKLPELLPQLPDSAKQDAIRIE